MYLPSFTSDVQPTIRYNMAELESAMVNFADKHHLTVDVFFELLFKAAIEYYVQVFCPAYYKTTTEEANARLYVSEYKLDGSRPKIIKFETIDEKVCLRVYADNNENSGKHFILNLLWQEILDAYLKHNLCNEAIVPLTSQSQTSDLLVTAEQRGVAGGLIAIPVREIIEKFFPVAEQLLPQILSDSVYQAAYKLPDNKINYEQIVEAANSIAATYRVDTHFSDVFEHTLCTVLNVPLAKSARFGLKEGNYAATKRLFCLELKISTEEAIQLMQNANTMRPGSVSLIYEPVVDSEFKKFDVEYDFVADCILPKMAEILEKRPDLIKLCQEQYRLNSADRSFAQFYADYHSAAPAPKLDMA